MKTYAIIIMDGFGYRKETHGWAATGKAVGVLVLALVLAAAAAYVSYFVFQLIASMFGVIDIHMIGTITYTNIPIVIGVGILTLSMIVFAVSHAVRHWKVGLRDLVRAFAYPHGVKKILSTHPSIKKI